MGHTVGNKPLWKSEHRFKSNGSEGFSNGGWGAPWPETTSETAKKLSSFDI